MNINMEITAIRKSECSSTGTPTHTHIAHHIHTRQSLNCDAARLAILSIKIDNERVLFSGVSVFVNPVHFARTISSADTTHTAANGKHSARTLTRQC